MTRRGGAASFSKAWASSVSCTTMAIPLLSKTLRKTCCWGRIRRPLGAALSMGVTRITTSKGWSKSPTSWRSVSLGFKAAMASFSSRILVPASALTRKQCLVSFIAVTVSNAFCMSSNSSILFKTKIAGRFFSCTLAHSASSSWVMPT